jgi:hypothetical protein
MNPRVTVVLLNWNGQQHVHRCLEHVLKQTYAPIEVIVVDNGSTDGSIEAIRMRYPNLYYIVNDRNLGFAGGMNQGIEAATGDFVIPLNQDVCMHDEFVEHCVRRAMEDQRIGAIGGRVFAWIGDELTFQVRRGEGEDYVLRKRFQSYAGNRVEGEKWTFGASGSFPFFRKAMLDDVKQVSGDYYDEAFETGWEDLDLFFRMHLRGWKCLFLPEAYGWHVGSGSVGGRDTFFSKDVAYQTRILRNRYFVIAKNLPAATLLRLSPYIAATELAMIPYFIVRSPKSLAAWWRAITQFLGSLGRTLRKRKAILTTATAPPDYLHQYFVRF